MDLFLIKAYREIEGVNPSYIFVLAHELAHRFDSKFVTNYYQSFESCVSNHFAQSTSGFVNEWISDFWACQALAQAIEESATMDARGNAFSDNDKKNYLIRNLSYFCIYDDTEPQVVGVHGSSSWRMDEVFSQTIRRKQNCAKDTPQKSLPCQMVEAF